MYLCCILLLLISTHKSFFARPIKNCNLNYLQWASYSAIYDYKIEFFHQNIYRVNTRPPYSFQYLSMDKLRYGFKYVVHKINCKPVFRIFIKCWYEKNESKYFVIKNNPSYIRTVAISFF